MHSTGNYIQYLVITYKGKESEKEYAYTHTYTQLNHFAVYLKHCKSTILQLKKKKTFMLSESNQTQKSTIMCEFIYGKCRVGRKRLAVARAWGGEMRSDY